MFVASKQMALFLFHFEIVMFKIVYQCKAVKDF